MDVKNAKKYKKSVKTYVSLIIVIKKIDSIHFLHVHVKINSVRVMNTRTGHDLYR